MWFRALVASSLVLFSAASAAALSPQLTARTLCAAGEPHVEWTVYSTNPELGATHDNVVVEVSVDGGPWTQVAIGAFTAANSFQFTGMALLPDGSLTVRVRASAQGAWSSGHVFEDWRYAQNAFWSGAAESIAVPTDCAPVVTNPGTGTPGYWKNHPDAWPVDVITIGGEDYTVEEGVDLLSTPPAGDKSYTLAHHLIAAELNALLGNDVECIIAVLDDAHAWLLANPVGSGVRGKSTAWAVGQVLSSELDAYNNGELCAPHRD